MMKISEMKKVLLQKLHDENCNFELSDINIKKVKSDNYSIQIQDFEPYRMRLFHDSFLGNEEYTVMIIDTVFSQTVAYTDNRHDYNIKDALIQLGYWAGNTL